MNYFKGGKNQMASIVLQVYTCVIVFVVCFSLLLPIKIINQVKFDTPM